MTTPVVRDDTVALVEEVQHLRVPVVGAQRPAVMEDERLRILATPVLVEDLDAVLCDDFAHDTILSMARLFAGCIRQFMTGMLQVCCPAASRISRVISSG